MQSRTDYMKKCLLILPTNNSLETQD